MATDLDTFLATAAATQGQSARLNALQAERATHVARVAFLDAQIADVTNEIGANVSLMTVQLVKAQDTLGQVLTATPVTVGP